MNPKQVLELLVEQGVLDKGQVDDLLQEISSSGKTVIETLVDYQILTEEQFFQVLANALGTEYIDLKEFEPPQEVLRLIPAGLARLHGAMPLGLSGDSITVALVDPLNSQVVEDLRFALGKDIYVVVSPIYQIEDLLKRFYGTDAASMDEILSQLGNEVAFGEDGEMSMKDVEAEANATPIIRYVDLIIAQAIADRASDIHFEPFETEFKIRYRVDGSLYEMAPPPRHLALPVISRVKSPLEPQHRRAPFASGRSNPAFDWRQAGRSSCLHASDPVWRERGASCARS
ncbi:MAG: ATPase, T2SS/T4P/T4SS family [Chthoniobacteraceae bacterium]